MLRAVGRGATLWIDSCAGTIAPADVEPQGWRYSSNMPYQGESWWQWTPDFFTKEKLLNEANSASFDIDGLVGRYTQIFKPGIPFQVSKRSLIIRYSGSINSQVSRHDSLDLRMGF